MNTNNLPRYSIFTALVIALAMLASTAHAALTASVSQDTISVDYNYHGSPLGITGEADPDVDLIIKMASPEGVKAMRTKQHVGGVLWMNKGELHMDNTPNMYRIFSTARPDIILSPGEREQNLLGYDALRKHIEVETRGHEGTESDNSVWFDQFVKYQEAAHLYGESVGQVKLVPDQGSGKYEMNMDWPYQAPPGDYEITVYAVRDGHVVETVQAGIKVQQVGEVRYLANMAFKNGALYGVLSILIALASGFGVGMIFRKGGGAH